MPFLVEPHRSDSWLFHFGGMISESAIDLTVQKLLWKLLLPHELNGAKYPVSKPFNLGFPTLSGMKGASEAAGHAPGFSRFWKYTFQNCYWGEKIEWKPNIQVSHLYMQYFEVSQNLEELKRQAKSAGFGFIRATSKVDIGHLYIKKC